LVHGLHARPASWLAEQAGRYSARLTLLNERNDQRADLRSVLDLVAAAVLHGDSCVLEAAGEDALQACAELAEYISRRLPELDVDLPEPVVAGSPHLPHLLRELGITHYSGQPASPGVARGCILRMGGLALPEQFEYSPAAAAAAEWQRLVEALAGTQAGTEARLGQAHSQLEQDILRACLALLRDDALQVALQTRVEAGHSAPLAVVEVIREYSDKLQASGSDYLRERVADLEDFGVQLLEHLGVSTASTAPRLTAPTILVAPNLSPRQLLDLNRDQLAGLVLTDAGVTAHAVILARGMGLPTLAAAHAALALPDGREALLDGARGLLIIKPDTSVERCYDREERYASQRSQRQAAAACRPAATADGWRIEVAANICTAEEAAQAVELGAEGVGLFRTEMLFSGRDSAPSEEEQYEIYCAALAALGGRTLILRTLDVGGDKPLPYLDAGREDNPFLGLRGLRLYPQCIDIFMAQLRAACRASDCGPLWLMAPMVSTLDEVRWLRAQVQAVQQQLTAEGWACNAAMPLGIMVEVPAVAAVMDQLCAELDFFSIGTNDLSQYFFAADRGNARVAGLAQLRHPAFLRLLYQIISATQAHGRWLGLCGEMARDPRNLPLLVGLGLSELSVNAPAIPEVKAALHRLDSTTCRELLARALACDSAGAVEALLTAQHAAAPPPLLTAELVELSCDCVSRGEVLHTLAQLVWAQGRCDNADGLEEALWAREATYATAVGHGLAVPHCKSEHATAGSIAVLKLQQPVAWEGADDGPVQVAIMLAMPAGDAGQRHLRVFARLARKLMDEGFRGEILASDDAVRLVEWMTQELELDQDGARQ
jgi:multiphosphoryl transfer protein